MDRRPWIAHVLAIGMLLASAVGHAAAPGLRAEAPAVDVGPVVAGDTAVARFILVNESQRDIRILRAAPS